MDKAKMLLSKETKLLRWCGQKKIFSKADVIKFGSGMFYLRADRTIRDFVQAGNVRRLDRQECSSRRLKGNMAWYEFIKM